MNNKQVNKLINEKSPYLLQHAHNPVNWYPWREEAFRKAEKEDKPIFLSIGYSTCHWCHVMERESFEDEEVADMLNKYFIAIKVDREERPDLDNVYMTFTQAITGQGGWPMSVFITPDKEPFYAATYLPKHTIQGRMGLMEVLEKINDAWNNKREKLLKSSKQIVNAVKNSKEKKEKGTIQENIIEKSFEEFKESYDIKYGGFGYKPKFPSPHNLYFLMRYWEMTKDRDSLNMVTNTLKSMYKGGIFDHIGYGFSRYSVDNKWLVPHFEKMLYDNALLTIAYLEAYQITDEDIYKEVAQKTLEYVLRDMTSINGGFYSAEDADSEGVEGKFYLWEKENLIASIGKEKGEEFCKYYDITEKGNFEGKNIPNLINISLEDIENDKKLKNNLEKTNKKLFEEREKRVHPYKDDKILTSWNGLMIAAMARGGRILDNDKYINEAEKTVDFIYENLMDNSNRLMARFRDGETAFKGYLSDYSFLVWGLIELYEATFKIKYIKKAINLTEDMIKLFWDDKEGGFYINGNDSENLVIKPKDAYDGAIPSGNSVAILNMLKLDKISGTKKFTEKAQKMFETFSNDINTNPQIHSYFLIAYMFYINSGKEIVLAGQKDNRGIKDMLNVINKSFIPFSIVVLNDKNKTEDFISFVKEPKMIDNKATAYICENFSCNLPTTDIEEFKKAIN